jgi:hypothetical protein
MSIKISLLMNFFLPPVNSMDLLFILKIKGYEFSVDLEIIKRAESSKFYGKRMSFLLNTDDVDAEYHDPAAASEPPAPWSGRGATSCGESTGRRW